MGIKKENNKYIVQQIKINPHIPNINTDFNIPKEPRIRNYIKASINNRLDSRICHDLDTTNIFIKRAINFVLRLF